MRGSYRESEPATNGYAIDRASESAFVSDDEIDRALHLLTEENVTGAKQKVEQQVKTGSAQQQILSLYDEFRPRLMRYIHSMYLKRDVVEEVIQETFLRLATELAHGNEIENVPGWIIRVAHNLAVDAIKKKEKDAARITKFSEIEFEKVVDPSARPDEVYRRKERINRLNAALSNFSPKQRQCFRLRAQGFRYKDIAHALGISEQRAAIVVKQVAVRLAAVCD